MRMLILYKYVHLGVSTQGEQNSIICKLSALMFLSLAEPPVFVNFTKVGLDPIGCEFGGVEEMDDGHYCTTRGLRPAISLTRTHAYILQCQSHVL